ncbi:hypothetical protein [Pseudoxanthomonas sp.]|uniref:hypothetical protein n=1 Tax=Pseudoxanthomonas sp. TaxID=1871049 RepID=UPI00258E9305|nr:hypothetical protein [Pseudoxanthomonas sp.]MCR6686524.1 hypothetical protein [Pseudoxanthomonas sp.]
MTPSRRAYLVAALTAVAGLAAGAAWPPPPIPKSQEGTDGWALPEHGLQRLSPKAMDEAGSIRWLGDGSGDGQVQEWRLVGILQAPQPVALVMVAATQPSAQGGRQKQKPARGQSLRLEPGAALPDGSLLAAIERDTITVERDGCRRTYKLYRPQPVSTSGACADTPAPEQRKSQ